MNTMPDGARLLADNEIPQNGDWSLWSAEWLPFTDHYWPALPVATLRERFGQPSLQFCRREQPPIDNAHVAPGCEPFTTAADYQPTDQFRIAIRRALTKFAATDARLTDCENEIVAASGIDAFRSARRNAERVTLYAIEKRKHAERDRDRAWQVRDVLQAEHSNLIQNLTACAALLESMAGPDDRTIIANYVNPARHAIAQAKGQL